jgi:hypothetical protein
VTTWEHRFSKEVHTKTEAYFMWQFDAVLGGTPSAGPVKPFGGGGGIGAPIPGASLAYGVLNFTMFQLSRKDFLAILGRRGRGRVERKAARGEAQLEFVLTKETEVLLDGKPCKYEDIPANASILKMEVAADRKTVLRVQFRSGK